MEVGTGSTRSSSLPEIGALARGELRVGRVEGLPIPTPNGTLAGVTGTGAATGGVAGGGGDGCFTGDPGGVVLASVAGALPLLPSVAAGVAGGEGEVSCILGVDASAGFDPSSSSDGSSGFGV